VKVHVLDLEYRMPGTVAAYLLEAGPDLALVETGPESCWPSLVAALSRLGVAPRDVRTVLVTHVHLDHAGAAWRLAREGAAVHVHPKGARALADPSKLLASARRIYGDRMEELWGTLEPIPAEQLRETEDGGTVLAGRLPIRVLATPGHASHHNTYLADGNAFTGDVGGVALGSGPVLPPTPPPDIDLPLWRTSIAKIREARPTALYPTHYARFEGVDAYLDRLSDELEAWASWVKARLDEGKDEPAIVPEFEAWLGARLLAAGVTPEEVAAYRVALPFAMNVTGLVRYWTKAAAA
jgi:glyoxylase-like metal-dependent hydrolase (beta-lactamase superfamily II)